MSPEIWDDFEPDVIDPPPLPPPKASVPAAEDRELWMRDYIDREQRFRLYFAKYISGLLHHDSSRMKLWRWLIDDYRSERREQAAYLNGGREAGLLPWARRLVAGRRQRRDFRR